MAAAAQALWLLNCAEKLRTLECSKMEQELSIFDRSLQFSISKSADYRIITLIKLLSPGQHSTG
jgi:hypothetical protein